MDEFEKQLLSLFGYQLDTKAATEAEQRDIIVRL
jgi:hypothetical protein